jgi:hypothetical protein
MSRYSNDELRKLLSDDLGYNVSRLTKKLSNEVMGENLTPKAFYSYLRTYYRDEDKRIRESSNSYTHKITHNDLSMWSLKNIIQQSGLRGKIRVMWYANKELMYENEYDVPNAVSSWYNTHSIWKDWTTQSPVVSEFKVAWDDGIRNQKIVIVKESPVEGKRLTQAFKEGITNCVLLPIRDWALDKSLNSKTKKTRNNYNTILNRLNKLEEKCKDGVSDELLQQIADCVKVELSVQTILSDEVYHHAKPFKGTRYHFKYINTSANHVDIGNYDSLVSDTSKEVIYLNQKEMRKKYLQFKNQKEVNAIYFKGKDGISTIKTLNKIYTIADDFKETKQLFMNYWKIHCCVINDLEEKELSQFILKGVHYNNAKTIKQFDKKSHLNYWLYNIGERNGEIVDSDYDEAYRLQKEYCLKKYDHLDQTKAYTQFRTCPFYEGFLGKITDFRKCNKIEGVGLYLIDNINFEKCDDRFIAYNEHFNYRNKMIYPSCELRFLESLGVQFDIKAGCWGVVELHFDFNSVVNNERRGEMKPPSLDKLNKKEAKEALKKYLDKLKEKSPDMLQKTETGVSYFGKCVGQWNSVNSDNSYYSYMERDMAEHLKSLKNENATITYFEELKEVKIDHKNEKINHYSHLTAFVLAYQRINTIRQLLKIEIDRVHRICGDGIAYSKGDVEIIKPFRLKNTKNGKLDYHITNDSAGSFIGGEEYNEEVKNEERPHYRVAYHKGAGGGGKTHKNLTDEGLIRPLYVVPSWYLSNDKGKEYKIDNSVVRRMLNEDPSIWSYYYNNFNVIIIDECSMINNEDKNALINRYDNHKLIFCGDIGYQLPPVQGEEMDMEGIENIVEYNHNYRSDCSKLNSLNKYLREQIEKGRSCEDVIDDLDLDYKNYDEVKELFNIEDRILCTTNERRKFYRNLLSDKFKYGKYHCREKIMGYFNGELVISNEEIDKEMKKQAERFNKSKQGDVGMELSYAETVHSVQGQSLKEHKIIIDTDRMWDNRHFYVAVSRARTYDQLYFV